VVCEKIRLGCAEINKYAYEGKNRSIQ